MKREVQYVHVPLALSGQEQAHLSGKRMLVLMASFGHAVQEALPIADALSRAGVAVVFATLDGGDVRFDPVCNALAYLEVAWSPALRLLRQARREKTLTDLPSLRKMAEEGSLDAYLDGFDGVFIPGGHGQVLAAFLRDPLVLGAVARFYQSSRATALICHAVIAGALAEVDGIKIASGKAVTCWPRAYEVLFGNVPLAGRYFMPFGYPVEDAIADAGAVVHTSALPWKMPHAVIDGHLVTGWGPWSADAFASALLRVLAHQNRRIHG